MCSFIFANKKNSKKFSKVVQKLDQIWLDKKTQLSKVPKIFLKFFLFANMKEDIETNSKQVSVCLYLISVKSYGVLKSDRKMLTFDWPIGESQTMAQKMRNKV